MHNVTEKMLSHPRGLGLTLSIAPIGKDFWIPIEAFNCSTKLHTRIQFTLTLHPKFYSKKKQSWLNPTPCQFSLLKVPNISHHQLSVITVLERHTISLIGRTDYQSRCRPTQPVEASSNSCILIKITFWKCAFYLIKSRLAIINSI